MRFLRQILRVSIRQRIRNEDIRNRCEQQPTIEELIQKRRLQWFGHVCRMSDSRLPRKLLWRVRPAQWKIQRSAPKKTWIKQVEEDVQKRRLSLSEAKQEAEDRNQWRQFITDIRQPLAPTAAYGLRSRFKPNAS